MNNRLLRVLFTILFVVMCVCVIVVDINFIAEESCGNGFLPSAVLKAVGFSGCCSMFLCVILRRKFGIRR